MNPSPRVLVFAYHNVGVRCLQVLRAHDVNVVAVVTHTDNPQETIWFDCVADTARGYDIPVLTPSDPNDPSVIASLTALQPDMIFSFYYRHMLSTAVLALAPQGAFNMHGSLLPHYRGRAPVNWAILQGEERTGVTLHEMVSKPDAGNIVAQLAVPILPDDDAKQVFDKVTHAAATLLDRTLPALLAGHAPRLPQSLEQGSYFSGRRPEEGRINWRYNAQQIHNLVRAVAPPYYPGAFFDLHKQRIRVWKTQVLDSNSDAPRPYLLIEQDRIVMVCVQGRLAVLHADFVQAEGNTPCGAAELMKAFHTTKIFLDSVESAP